MLRVFLVCVFTAMVIACGGGGSGIDPGVPQEKPKFPPASPPEGQPNPSQSLVAWDKVGDSVTIGDVCLTVVASMNTTVATTVTLELANLSPTKRIRYVGASAKSSRPARMIDEHENVYKPVRLPASWDELDVVDEPIAPQKSLKVNLSYETISPNSKMIRLILAPGSIEGIDTIVQLQYKRK